MPNSFTADVEFLHSGGYCIQFDIRVESDILSKLLKQNSFEIVNGFDNLDWNLDLLSTVLDQGFHIDGDLFHQMCFGTVNHCVGVFQFEWKDD